MAYHYYALEQNQIILIYTHLKITFRYNPKTILFGESLRCFLSGDNCIQDLIFSHPSQQAIHQPDTFRRGRGKTKTKPVFVYNQTVLILMVLQNVKHNRRK